MEAMAAEALVASAWELDGFLTKVRWPVKLVSGQFSDVDVIGISTSGTVRLAECKVPSGPRHVYVVGDDFADAFGGWLSRFSNIERLWAAPPPWLPRARDVAKLEFWVCANVWFPDELARERACYRATQLARKACPSGIPRRKVSVHIKSTRDVLLEVIAGVRRAVIVDGHGRRFGHPVLDTIRELVRFSNPAPNGGGRMSQRIADETRFALLEALGLDVPSGTPPSK